MTTPPILLVPGLNCTERVFAGLLPALWQHGPVTIANHRAGSSMAEIAAAILVAAPPRFALAGFSMGGYIAFEMLRQAPERIVRLALIDTGAGTDTKEQRDNRLRQIALAEAGKFDSVAGANFANAVHPDHAGDPTLKALHRAMALDGGAELYCRHQRAILGRVSSEDLLATITVPTVILVGDQDQVTPRALSEKMQKNIAGSKLFSIAEAGHLSPLEQPVMVSKVLTEWLAG